ncbi:MAG: bifunctional diaminohydroxyphosphoribosylaminopyrimidine deaminase/5-amino-6-(5-phosphoribosylamino)uracil reductase RibD [Thermoanaerobaculia bacterium]
MPASSPPPCSETEARLQEALRWAARGRYRTAPNPRVGALLVANGRVVGRGFHAEFGGPHAEILALSEAGARARGATLFVTLEPCVHHGRTPPCVAAIIAAGVERVVFCHRDPDPRVAGRGRARLVEAGIAVDSGHLVAEAVELNLPFLIFHLRGRPAVTLKWAMTLDGRIATATGESRWISSVAGRRWGLALREEHDAIVVGSGTVLADDPRLDRRLGRARGPILRVVLDRRLRLTPERRLFAIEGPVLVYTESSDAARREALASAGAEVVGLLTVTPATVAADLMARGIQSVLVEGGAGVLGAFVAAGLFDRVAVDLAPKLVGGEGAPGPVAGVGVQVLADALELESVTVGRRGGDVVVNGIRRGCLRELSASLVE